MEYHLGMFLFEHQDFTEFFGQVRQKRGIPEAIVEKDYWVTYVLYHLQNSEFSGKFIFKGGTSLSKGWNLLDRFSEDIDLLFLPDGLSGKAKQKRLEKVRDFVGGLPKLKFDDQNKGNRRGNDSRTSCFEYPRQGDQSLIQLPSLKLEMGFRGGLEPSESRKIQSYIGTALELAGQKDLAQDVPGFNLNCLHPKRTFVEKLFALHDAYASNEVEAKVRHYYDVYQLLALKEVTDFLGTGPYKDLKMDVAQFTKDNFTDSKVPEGNDFSTSNAFSPSSEMAQKISRAHDTSTLFFGKRPSAKEILERIKKFRSQF